MTRLAYFYWPEFLGGPLDGQPVPEKLWKSKMVERDGEKYFRNRHSFGPAAIGCFVWELWPRQEFWPYAVTRRILSSHPQLQEVVLNDD